MKRTYDESQDKFQEISASFTNRRPESRGRKLARSRTGTATARRRGRRRGASDHGDVVDAEFEVVDEDKKK